MATHKRLYQKYLAFPAKVEYKFDCTVQYYVAHWIFSNLRSEWTRSIALKKLHNVILKYYYYLQGNVHYGYISKYIRRLVFEM